MTSLLPVRNASEMLATCIMVESLFLKVDSMIFNHDFCNTFVVAMFSNRNER